MFRLLLFPALSAVAILAHLLSPGWVGLYLYNGDSLTLALIGRSIERQEPFDWILSSQLFLYPEGLFYFISNVISPTVKLSFVINTVFNVFSLYLLYYYLAMHFLKEEYKSELAAMASLGIIVLLTLLETSPDINNRTLITPFFFNTYYYGAVLSSLLSLLLYFKLFRYGDRGEVSRSRALIISFLLVFNAGLTYFSNPLYLLYFTIPFVGCVAFAWFLGKANFIVMFFSITTQVAGILLGLGGRYLFRDYIGNSVSSYMHMGEVLNSFVRLAQVVRSAYGGMNYGIEWTLVLLFVLFSAITAFYLLARKKSCGVPLSIFLLAAFAIFSPIATVLGIAVSGQSLTRYLLPVVCFPPLVITTWLFLYSNRPYSVYITWAGLGLYAFLIFISLPSSPEKLIEKFTSSPESVACYNRHMADFPFHSVGGFWTTRMLDLYSVGDSRALQATSELVRREWMNNKALFSTLEFSGVIVDKSVSGERNPDHIYPEDIKPLSNFSRKFDCPSFDIYYYEPGSKGYEILNSRITQ